MSWQSLRPLSGGCGPCGGAIAAVGDSPRRALSGVFRPGLGASLRPARGRDHHLRYGRGQPAACGGGGRFWRDTAVVDHGGSPSPAQGLWRQPNGQPGSFFGGQRALACPGACRWTGRRSGRLGARGRLRLGKPSPGGLPGQRWAPAGAGPSQCGFSGAFARRWPGPVGGGRGVATGSAWRSCPGEVCWRSPFCR